MAMDAPAVENRYRLFSHAAVAIALGVLATLRLLDPAMSRPFEADELLTTFYYTWVGLRPDGEVARLNHIEELYALPAPGLSQLGMGVYCSVGRWPEPNNHILNSLLVNLALLVERNEWAVRLPALLGAVVFVGGLYTYCSSVLGCRAVAPLAAVAAWFCPYVVTYSITARGYSWMLALQVLLLLAAAWLARRPASVTRGAVCAFLAVLSFLNVINMAVDWLLPAYLALFAFPPAEQRSAWRKNLAAQALGVGSVGLLFLVSHLPSVYSSARQYGLPFASLAGFFTQLAVIFEYLFPALEWQGFALLAAVGLILLIASRRHHLLAALILLTVAVSLAHFVATRKLPFERTAGYLLPLAVLSAAYAVEWSVRYAGEPLRRGLVWAVWAGLTLLLVLPSLRPAPLSGRLEQTLELARQVEPVPGLPMLMLYGYSVDYLEAIYRPRDWPCVEVVPAGTGLQVLAFVGYRDETGFNLIVPAGVNRFALWKTQDWEFRSYPVAWPYAVLHMVGDTRPFPDAGEPPSRALVFWYPDPTRLGINGGEQLDYMNDSGTKYVPRYTRYQAKLDLFLNLEAIVCVAESAKEYREVGEVVREGLRRFGGRAVVFVPRASQ